MSGLKEERVFGTEISQVQTVLGFVEEFLEKAGLLENSFEIQLAVEEWYVNIVKHGFQGKNEGTVNMRMELSEGTLEIEMDDGGPEFDPHTLPAPEQPESVEEAKSGGLGVFFIRKLMDQTAYRREKDRNIFIMRKGFP